jgi:extracellular elastinolytic metalloproteinase
MGIRPRAIAPAVLLVLVLALAVPVGAQDDGRGEVDAAVEVARGLYPGVEVAVTDAYTSDHNGVAHVYLRQVVGGTPVVGAEATVNVQDGEVVLAGDRFVDASAASGAQVLSATAATSLAMAETESAGGRVVEAPALVYRALPDGSARLAWHVQIEVPHHLWSAFVDAEDGTVLHVSDFVDSEEAAHLAASTARPEDAAGVAQVLHAADEVGLAPVDGTHNTPIYPPDQAIDGSSYNVYPLPLESPLDGTRRIVDNPADAFSSPFGWHDTDGVEGPEHTTTRGNNVWAYADTAPDNTPDPASQPDGGPGLDFDHLLLTYDATPATYRDAAVDNLFY